MEILFICKGSVSEGLGHINRTIAVANAATNRFTIKIVFIGDKKLLPLFQNSTCSYCCVNDERAAVLEVTSHKPQIVVFDMLTFDETNFQNLSQKIIFVSLSPIFNLLDKMALFFHRTKYLPKKCLQTNFLTNCKVFAGLDYAVISKRCTRIAEEIYINVLKKPAFSIAISMGGADAANKTLKIINRLRRFPKKLVIWVLLGEGYEHSYQQLVDSMRGSSHEIILAKTNDSMWHILNMCSVAILAGGITTYEAAFAGLPSINLLENSEHSYLIDELVELGVCYVADTDFPVALDEMFEIITNIENEREMLINMRAMGMNIINDKGVECIVDKILEFARNHFEENRNH
ncbi:MAG: hypothetical protein WCV63_00550 [Negativicutes bacterium]